MPRRRVEPPPAPIIPTTSLVASATRYTGKAPRIFQARKNWQSEAYRHFSICGEARFAATFFGHAMSRATLQAATVEPGGNTTVVTTGPASDYLNALFNGHSGQTQMLNALGVHLTIAGEAYLVGRVVEGVDVWEVISVMELSVTGDKWSITYGDERGKVDLEESDVVIRIWTPEPGNRMNPDSPFKALLPILGEIEWLTRHIFAQITSRLAGAGILLMPQGMTFPPPPAVDGKEVVTTNDADTFMATLADAMLAPIEDPSLPSAMVPIVVTAPDDAIDKPRLLTFWTELDAAAMDLRNEAIRRFALGMDLPPEQVLGMSAGGTGGGTSNGVSHWGAWQIEESTIKMHIEPMLDVITSAITVGYLWPLLGEGDAQAAIISDTSMLRLRPDRSQEAFELYDRGLITADALRRENGFSEDDKPTEDEFQQWLLVKIAGGSATPEQVQVALRILGVDLGPLVTDEAPREARPDPSLEDHPANDLPRAASLLAATDALCYRALERAGNRLRQGISKPPGVPTYETHLFVKANGSAPSLLADAWSCAPQILNGIADPEAIIPVLDSYCTSLLAEQSPHSRERLADWLKLAQQ